MITRALISVSDKKGIVPFCLFLQKNNIEILSTGGTAKVLRENNIAVQDVSEYTQFPEMLDGRVKTLHPKIHGGLLYKRHNEDHQKTVKEYNIGNIDLVVVNLYPFAEVLQKGGSEEELIENIDIGGPSMLRSAAKNFESVTVITDPNDYDLVQTEMENNRGDTSLETRKYLMGKVYATTAQYDAMIATAFTKNFNAIFPTLKQSLRYGENPHQSADVFTIPYPKDASNLAEATPIQGKELSYNNLLDSDAALRGVLEFTEPSCVIVKHLSPCGIAMGHTAQEAYEKALEADNASAFGGVVAINREIDGMLAKKMNEHFLEIIIAPSFTEEAKAEFMKKQNLRLIALPKFSLPTPENFRDFRSIFGGILVQSVDCSEILPENLTVVTKKQPTPEEMEDLLFAWKCVKTVKSNAIVLAKNKTTVGIGGGLTSRVDASELAVKKAGEKAKGSVCASDAFFPFADGPQALASAGITAIIQPGGSKNDEAIIEACNQLGIAIVFTGYRVFRH